MALQHGAEKALVFLVCPQRDFIGRSDEASPNRLHVGEQAVARLRGTGEGRDPFVETVRLLYDAAIPGTESLEIVIDEDWHPHSCEEFPIFGEHCLKGTAGAELVGGLEEMRWHPRTHVLRANSINIAAVPGYRRLMKRLVGHLRPDSIRVGVLGVWTHVKVEYLLLNLRTLAPQFIDIAVCEPLCASPDEADHRHAIAKFRMLGFTVHEQIGEFLTWLGLDPQALPR